jgi:hypothetical protein
MSRSAATAKYLQFLSASLTRAKFQMHSTKVGQLFVYRCLLKAPLAKLVLVLPDMLTSDRAEHTAMMDELEH